MKPGALSIFAVMGCLAWAASAVPACADDAKHLSPERLDVLDARGVFSPDFKAAVHDLVDTKQNIRDTQAEQKKLNQQLPDLVDQQQKAVAEADALRAELAKYEHPDEVDFTILQSTMKDSSAKTDDQLALAQAFVWTYPTSPHAPEAQQELAQMQKQIATQQQTAKDAEAAREAAHADLIKRAEAKELSLEEWRGFLNDMSQEDLLKYLGQPDKRGDDYWIYSGAWSKDPVTSEKTGLEINFNAGRVQSVDKAPAQ